MTDDDSPGIPARALPTSARAPGKCIVFGEHAVVHGGPELLFALDLETQVALRPNPRLQLNGDPEAPRHNRYFAAALDIWWPSGEPLEVRSVSRVPRAAGLGSSAAFVSALSAAFAAATGGIDRPRLAARAFSVERQAQGVGSPGDTSASVAGGFVTINDPAGELLWTVRDDTRSWSVRRIPDPGWAWVVAYSGIPRSTADAVRAVTERLARPDGPTLLDEFASVAHQGIAAVQREDIEDVRTLMERNQTLLRDVGVSHPQIERLLTVGREVGASGKVTGAGAGGSALFLPALGREIELSRRLARAGAVPFVVRPSRRGAELVDRPSAAA